MTKKKAIEVEAKTTQEAIAIALKELDAERDEVEVEILNEESKGLFELEGSKRARVKVIVKGE